MKQSPEQASGSKPHRVKPKGLSKHSEIGRKGQGGQWMVVVRNVFALARVETIKDGKKTRKKEFPPRHVVLQGRKKEGKSSMRKLFGGRNSSPCYTKSSKNHTPWESIQKEVYCQEQSRSGTLRKG